MGGWRASAASGSGSGFGGGDGVRPLGGWAVLVILVVGIPVSLEVERDVDG